MAGHGTAGSAVTCSNAFSAPSGGNFSTGIENLSIEIVMKVTFRAKTLPRATATSCRS